MPLQTCNEAWSPPVAGSYKVNSDATIFNNNRVGVGALMRDFVGDVMCASCCQFEGSYEIDIAEALAARHAIFIALEAGLTNLVFLITSSYSTI